MFSNSKVKLDAQLFDRLSRRSKDLGYATVQEFITHVLERELQTVTEQETREKVMQKMKGLGYLQ